MSEEKTRPAMNFIGSKGSEKDAKIEFDDKSMSVGAWGAVTKNGDNYVRGKCPNCGSKIWGFCNSKDGWKLLKEDVTPKEDW